MTHKYIQSCLFPPSLLFSRKKLSINIKSANYNTYEVIISWLLAGHVVSTVWYDLIDSIISSDNVYNINDNNMNDILGCTIGNLL